MSGFKTYVEVTVLVGVVGCSTPGQDDYALRSDEATLKAVAALAQAGSSTVCDPQALENALGIRIGALRTTLETHGGRSIERQQSMDVEDRQQSVFLKGAYLRFRSPSASQCSLEIRFSQNRLCHTQSNYVASLMKSAVEYGPEPLHGAPHGSAIEYRYKNSGGTHSVVILGSTRKECANGFVIIANGDWSNPAIETWGHLQAS